MKAAAAHIIIAQLEKEHCKCAKVQHKHIFLGANESYDLENNDAYYLLLDFPQDVTVSDIENNLYEEPFVNNEQGHFFRGKTTVTNTSASPNEATFLQVIL